MKSIVILPNAKNDINYEDNDKFGHNDRIFWYHRLNI